MTIILTISAPSQHAFKRFNCGIAITVGLRSCFRRVGKVKFLTTHRNIYFATDPHLEDIAEYLSHKVPIGISRQETVNVLWNITIRFTGAIGNSTQDAQMRRRDAEKKSYIQ